MAAALPRCYCILLFIYSSTSEATPQTKELDELKMEIDFLKQVLLQQLPPTPDLSPSFNTAQILQTQAEENIEPTPTLWTTSLYTSVDISTITIPTTSIIPINIGGLAGHTYTVVDTVTSLLTSTATLTTSVRITPTSSLKQTASSTSLPETASTTTLPKTASANTLPETSRKSSISRETFDFSSSKDFSFPSRKARKFTSRKARRFPSRKAINFRSTKGISFSSSFDLRNNQTTTEIATFPTPETTEFVTFPTQETTTEFATFPTENSKLRSSTPKPMNLKQSRLSIFDTSNRKSLIKVSTKFSKPRRVQLITS